MNDLNGNKLQFKRDLHKCLCNYCGSSSEVFFDSMNDSHICLECLTKEYDLEDLDDEDNSQNGDDDYDY